MIVDVHYHLNITIPVGDHIPNLEWIAAEPLRAAKIIGKKVDTEALKQKGKRFWADRNGKKAIRIMDDAGIDFAIIFGLDNASNPDITKDLVVLQNKIVGDVAKNYSDRMIAFAAVDPRRPEALDILKQCFEEFGMKGLKYHGDFGFDPSGPESYKLLKYLEKNNGILLTHTGPLSPPSRNKFVDSMLLSDIGVNIPNLKIIAAHMGSINWRPWASLAAVQPNLYGDLAMWAPFAIGRFELFCRELRDLIDYAGVEKVLFGSDAPIYDIVLPVKDFIDVIKNLPKNAPKGIKFTEDEIDAILGGNAAKLLGLTE